eukprot:gene5074-8674_t
MVLDQPLLNKILIANRGEIACRVIQTCKKLGIKTVAVYSEADVNSKHVSLADEAYLIGPPEVNKSYLLGDKILEIAKKSNSQGIHPGYGFLSENANFSSLCSKENISFIGPGPFAIKSMGSKQESKILMEKANVPVVPGYHGDDQSEEVLMRESDKIGYPVLIKAVSGGGGKGMKIVEKREDFIEQLQSAKREAMNHFADDKVLVEKYLTKPRHIEIQVFGDTHGNYVYLFERDCSIQRRHQKVIEEAPAPGITEEMRQKMGQSAIDAAKAVGYVGAGTVEFIFEDNIYYFMEMNTRLQVEHPITEMITKQDLVEWQIQVASGNKLPLEQKDLKIHGHAFEGRIYSEDPNNNFLPVTGELKYLNPPKEIENNVRVDSGVRQGDEVSIYYDPMIAKLVVWGKDRDDALRKFKKSLDDYHLVGLPNNIDFLKNVVLHSEFIKGNVETNFIPKNYNDLFLKKEYSNEVYILAVCRMIFNQYLKNKENDLNSPWKNLIGFRLNNNLNTNIKFNEINLNITILNENELNIKFNESNEIFNVKFKSIKNNEIVATINNIKYVSTVVLIDNSITVFFNGSTYELNTKVLDTSLNEDKIGSLKSPMPGKIIKVNVKQGDKVKKGQPLIIMEAMKMEHTIRATSDGVVKKIHFKVGDMVKRSSDLAELE